MASSQPHRDARRALSTRLAALWLGAIVVAAPAAAQNLLSAPPNRSVQAANSGLLAAAIAQWQALRQSDALSFAAYADFLIAHPGWPMEAALRRNAERALRADGAPPGQVVAFFRRYPPQSPAAWLRYAEALDGSGQRPDARVAAANAWRGGALSTEDEGRLLLRFADAIGPTDQDIRMDRLLWQRATSAAARQLALTSPSRRAQFDARLALLTKASDAYARAALINDAARGDPGYLLDRATWLRATGQEQAARALLAAPRALVVRPLDVEKWYEGLLATARGAAAAGQYQLAYDVARQVDDAYPPGTEVRDRPLGERDDYTSLVWLAGSTALNQLGRPLDALPLFERYARAARSPQTQSKGLYWAGRAAEAAGQRDQANGYYVRAARFFDQFYGQLATERLGLALAVPPVTDTLEISANQREAFLNSEIVRAAEYLGRSGDWAAQSLFIRQIAAAATSDVEHLLALELSRRLYRPDLAVMVGRSAGINNLRDYVRAGFPTVPVAPEDAGSWTIMHAIARQESQFDRKIVSRAGARGLMQLMPGTARDAATRLGLAYAPSSLDDPTYNIQLGTWFFGRLMDVYGGNYVLAVAAYNAGPGNVNKWLAANGDPRRGADVLRWIEAIPFKETRGYVQSVLENAVVYDLLNPGRVRVPSRTPLSTYLGKSRPG